MASKASSFDFIARPEIYLPNGELKDLQIQFEKLATSQKEHSDNMDECGKCIWIDESSNAMSEYGAQIVVEEQPHPLTNYIIDKFNGREI